MVNIILLVGPSGSGKTAISQELIKDKRFTKIATATTRPKRSTETNKDYHFLTERGFIKATKEKKFIETNNYAGYNYGTPKKDIEEAILANKIIVMPIDINGARNIREHYSSSDYFKPLIVFVYRNKAETISAILDRDISIEEKKKRIYNIDKEYENISECDICIVNTHSLKYSVENIKKIIF